VWVYTCVVLSDACPRSSCTARRSAPASSMCVAKVWRRECTRSVSPPTASNIWWMARCTPRGASRRPRPLTNTAPPAPPGAAPRRFPVVKIAPERGHRPRANRHDALLPALAADLGLIGQQVEVLEVHPAQLREADAGGVEQLEHGKISRRRELVGLGPRLG